MPASQAVPLGACVPPNTQHAVSVSLPTWEDNVDYEKGAQRVLSRMVSGYPRFFIAKPIQALAAHLCERLALPGEAAMLFPSQACAERCAAFIYDQAPKQQSLHSAGTGAPPAYEIPRAGQVRIVQYVVEAASKEAAALGGASDAHEGGVAVHCVLFPEALFPLAKQYWQHTGNGVSARMADYCLRIERANETYSQAPGGDCCSGYRRGSPHHRATAAAAVPAPETLAGADLEASAYIEERFGRNLDGKCAAEMKQALRRRIAGALGPSSPTHDAAGARSGAPPSADDVYLMATGASAVFYAHQAVLGVRAGKSVCFGFPYTDTLKILEKFGPGAYFLGHGEGRDYEELERLLAEHAQSPEGPIAAIFTECPSNPMLKTADLARLRALADRYGAAVVVDETIGSFANIDVLPWADVVVSSLTKVFSGDSNVMGGSLVLNPAGALYAPLRAALATVYEDLLWREDAIFLERNSRDFARRVVAIGRNALAVAELLQASAKVASVQYPKFTTPANYARLMRDPSGGAGYGGLLSVFFVGGERAAQAFYDHLQCCKGPSLGTNFTLASPYTILAHYYELDWAAQFGVTADLVRISIGLEPAGELLAMMQLALDAVPEC
ncbi:Cystathionine gamma-synthase [Coemansia nantahalensis]|uniref:Cystathionine gamma-synthase n=1 Tax=Coemansia nantahalensis TaxID=2789366 RepID=A0ACC1JRI4_9FUNG|nr:Cystathionine gamma-synthase [Coemansia nantahalensis]